MGYSDDTLARFERALADMSEDGRRKFVVNAAAFFGLLSDRHGLNQLARDRYRAVSQTILDGARSYDAFADAFVSAYARADLLGQAFAGLANKDAITVPLAMHIIAVGTSQCLVDIVDLSLEPTSAKYAENSRVECSRCEAEIARMLGITA